MESENLEVMADGASEQTAPIADQAPQEAPSVSLDKESLDNESLDKESLEKEPKETSLKSAEGEEVVVSRASPGLLQAILLASGEPVSFVRLQDIMRCTRPEVAASLETLRQLCSSDASGVEIVTVGERLQLRTKVAFAESVRELLAVKPRRLSQAALETLSVVAYQQPIVKSEIDKIRGVDVAPTLKTLLERKIIKIIGYQASVGQPALYGTTEDFLRIFGLGSLSELPALRDLRALAKEPGEVGEVRESDADDGVEAMDGAESADSADPVVNTAPEGGEDSPPPHAPESSNNDVEQIATDEKLEVVNS